MRMFRCRPVSGVPCRKRQLLTTEPVLSKLRAVRENRMIDIPFTHLVPNISSAKVAPELAHRFKAIAL